MKSDTGLIQSEDIESLIRTIRWQKVLLDSDLARLYGVETEAFNRAIKRNADRFPPGFMFQLTREECDNLKYEIGTSSSGHGGRRRLPWAFTENGAVVSANALESPQAARRSVFVVRAFVKISKPNSRPTWTRMKPPSSKSSREMHGEPRVVAASLEI